MSGQASSNIGQHLIAYGKACLCQFSNHKLFEHALSKISSCNTLFILLQDVLSFLCRNLVNNVPLFQNADPNFLKAVITNLQYEVFQKNDMIIREGATAERMFFIESGIVSVETAFYQKLLSDGAYFGGL